MCDTEGFAFFLFLFSALVPDKWVEFKLQDTARVSQNTNLYRYIYPIGKIMNLDAS
jgi:hypothetical protein